jgi:hypothetical protein
MLLINYQNSVIVAIFYIQNKKMQGIKVKTKKILSLYLLFPFCQLKNGGFVPLNISGEGLQSQKSFKTPTLDVTLLLYLLETAAGVG